jgi:hypothetical protein
MAKEVMVAVFMSAAARLPPSTTTNMNKMADSPINQEPSEMQISFMGLPQVRIWPWINAGTRESETKQHFKLSDSYPRLSAFIRR